MRLLVSVADAAEARAALAGGADIIDAKEPRHGALGAVAPDVLRAIRNAVAVRRPVSAALGADIVGVRGAACVGGRTGRIQRARVARLRALADPASAAQSTAFV